MGRNKKVDVRDAVVGVQTALRKRKLSSSRNARYNQRLPPLQLELANAAKLFRRQLERARKGQPPSLTHAGQRQTAAPRRWCLVASLFGGSDVHPMYVRGALLLAAALPLPWALWLAVDRATASAWGELLSAAANIHLVVVDQPPEVLAPTTTRRERGRRAEGWAVNMFTRYLLFDDPCLAGAVVGDLDVQGDAALKHIKLWKCMDATCEDAHDVAYGVVSYPVGPDRGMPGRRTTWNGGAVAIAKRRPCAPDFAGSIASFIGAQAGGLKYGCDETWLGRASPISTTYDLAPAAVFEITDGSGKEAPILAGVPRRPQDALFAINDCVLTRTPDVQKCRAEAETLAGQLRGGREVEQLRAVHALLTSPSTHAYEVGWVSHGGRYANLL